MPTQAYSVLQLPTIIARVNGMITQRGQQANGQQSFVTTLCISRVLAEPSSLGRMSASPMTLRLQEIRTMMMTRKRRMSMMRTLMD